MYTASQQYGTGTNSSIKTVVDNWYSSNLNSYSGYISKTAIYCNDRTVGSGTWSATGSDFSYAAKERLQKDYKQIKHQRSHVVMQMIGLQQVQVQEMEN